MMKPAAAILIALALLLNGCTKTNNDDQKPLYLVPPTAAVA